MRRSRGGECVGHVVPSGHGEADRRLLSLEHEPELDAVQTPVGDPGGGDGHPAERAEGHLAAREGIGRGRHQRIVGVHHRRGRGPQPPVELGLGLGHAVQRAEPFEVCRRHAGDDPDVGFGDLGETPDLAGAVHAELEDGDDVGIGQAEQGEGQPDQIVLRARRPQHPARAERPLQDGRQHLLGGGLAVAAGDRDDARTVAAAVEGGEVAEGRQGVAHHDDATSGHPLFQRTFQDDRARATAGGVADEGVTVVRVAPDGDEELPRRERPAVGGDAGEAGGLAEPRQRPSRRSQDLLEREDGTGGRTRLVLGRDHRTSSTCPASWVPRARRTSSRSSRWRFS